MQLPHAGLIVVVELDHARPMARGELEPRGPAPMVRDVDTTRAVWIQFLGAQTPAHPGWPAVSLQSDALSRLDDHPTGVHVFWRAIPLRAGLLHCTPFDFIGRRRRDGERG